MKTIKLILVVLCSLIMCVSCMKGDFKTYTQQEVVSMQYNSAFSSIIGDYTKHIGNWGFPESPALTRTAMPNSNEWGTNNGVGYLQFPKPANITPEEREAVLAVFNQKGKEKYESILDVDSFFVQQVYCGPNGWKMNELATTVDYKRELVTKCWWPLDQEVVETACDPYDDIINNFNAGKYSDNAEQGCMLMYNSATLDFSFKTSQSAGQRIYGHWRMEKINGNYYVGFDHEAWRQAPANANEEDKRDYIYNDWIIKIVPGKGYSEEDKVKESGRIICEDLGTIGDFDFNDVVFDATIYESGKTIITILAAGGKLDISVAGVYVGDPNVMGKMVNTIKGGATHEPYTFEATNKYNSLKDIPVIVNKNDDVYNVYSYELSCEAGQAPQKICVPNSFRWCQEYKNIKEVYPHFITWVTGGKFWNSDVNEDLLY